MLNELLKFGYGNSVCDFTEYVRQGIPSAVFGVNDSFKYFLLSQIDSPVLFVVKDGLIAKQAKSAIEAFSYKSVVILPPKDEILVARKAFSKDSYYERIAASEMTESADVVIATPESLMQTLPSVQKSFTFIKGKDYGRDRYLSYLVDNGYKRTETVENKGAFAVRGDTLDVYPVNYPSPVRVDFFGDTVDSIKTFDESTREISGFLQSVAIAPAIDVFCNVEKVEEVLSLMREEIRRADKNAVSHLKDAYEDAVAAAESGDTESLAIYLSALESNFFTRTARENTVVVFDDAKRVYEAAELCYADFSERAQSLIKAGGAFLFMKKAMISVETLKAEFMRFRNAAVQSLATAVPFFNPLKIINPEVSAVADYKHDFNEFVRDLDRWLASKYAVLVCAGDSKRAEKLSLELSARGIASSVGSANTLGGVAISYDNLFSGFVYHEKKTVVIGTDNLYAKKTADKKLKSKKKSFFTAPEVGDYAVHEVYGVGKVLGNKKITSPDGGVKDCVCLEYAGGDVLYVPVTQMDNLSRYLGGEQKPKLSKIGGRDFERIKSRVKESIKKMSFDLKRLYEERKSKTGFAFRADTEMQALFLEKFPFEDTDDQTTATDEIIADMTSDVVMDRLLCGDVGFGKTEVAFRAAFLAIINSKQVALLAPTTILTEQHYNTAVERFKDFGVKIACLNRFRTVSEQKKIIEKLQKGEIDLVIGTHRLLGKDVGFYDLGLLILDEEQRFGVEHKEKIKLLKKNVDTLTLTATPIPRTLHMSLSGIRAISTLNTPPKKRLPVQTYVTEETDMLIYDAVSREINRGGQAFILYNRVESIYSFAEKVKQILPSVRLTVAHGQMDERTLENGIVGFYNGEGDVLISTTIIENGIDLPKANTLIVIDADKLGLSTLYQLKGRVGRSDRLAYAYFTFKRDKILTETAYNRLDAITAFAEMGSGIKIAMRDLEIRGAGNVLGAEQHGHMDKIGYELYSKLLKEELSGKTMLPIDIDVQISAFISDDYIANSSARMDAYKQIAEIETADDEREIISAFEENYGRIPEETDNLILISMVKRLAMKFGVTEISVKKGNGEVAFESFKAFADEGLKAALDEFKGKVVLSMTDKPRLSFVSPSNDNVKVLNEIKRFFYAASAEKTKEN